MEVRKEWQIKRGHWRLDRMREHKQNDERERQRERERERERERLSNLNLFDMRKTESVSDWERLSNLSS